MIVDFDTADLGQPFAFDVCIIGSGAAGITAAREFAGTPHTVCVLEGGGGQFEESSQEPYHSRVVGLPHGGIHDGRARVVGGSTTLWAGQALPFFDVDFRARDWVPGSGWPITRDTLTPFYARAEDVMQIPHATYCTDTWPRRPPPPPYDPARLTPYYSQFAAVPNFARKYRAALHAAPNITLLTHANAVSLEATQNAAALREVRVHSFAGRDATVQARFFLVCCGGIETARLLLLSNSVESNGLGNRHDAVGRYFMDHPGFSLPVVPLATRQFRQWCNSFRKRGIRYGLNLAASETLQEKERILHVSSSIYYPPAEGEDPIDAAKQLLGALRAPGKRASVRQAFVSVTRRPGMVAAAALRFYVLRQPATVGSGPPRLGLGGEQGPNPDSRITLGTETDSLGMRRAILDWRVSETDARSMSTLASTVADEWQRLGIAKVDLSEMNLDARRQGQAGGFVDANHHMGTARMGVDPKTSVVDARCRVHGYDNLYVGSSAVFPTGSFSNPTLTILALCLRIADELKLRLVQERRQSV